MSGPAKAFREVVSDIIVDLRKASKKYQYEIKGWLSAIAGDELSVSLMIAEVRSDHDSRQHERTEISLGTWQIELKRAIRQYLEKTKETAAANDLAAARLHQERS